MTHDSDFFGCVLSYTRESADLDMKTCINWIWFFQHPFYRGYFNKDKLDLSLYQILLSSLKNIYRHISDVLLNSSIAKAGILHSKIAIFSKRSLYIMWVNPCTRSYWKVDVLVTFYSQNTVLVNDMNNNY